MDLAKPVSKPEYLFLTFGWLWSGRIKRERLVSPMLGQSALDVAVKS